MREREDMDVFENENKVRFYHCDHCGSVVAVLRDGGCAPSCCGAPMELLVAQTGGAGSERHVPMVEHDGDHLVVRVGEIRHDMVEEHLIEWIALERGGRLCFKFLKPEEEPKASLAPAIPREARSTPTATFTASGRRSSSDFRRCGYVLSGPRETGALLVFLA